MPQAVAVPLGAAGIGALGSIVGMRSGKQKPISYTPTPEQTAAQGSITNLARMLQGQAQGIYDVGLPAYQRATGFYNSLIGSKASQQQSLAPALENTADAYAGATNSLEARGVSRGPAMDLAKAQLARDSAGAAANMYRDAPFQAAGALGQLGVAGLGQAQNAGGSALSGYNALLGNYGDQQKLGLLQGQQSYQNSQAFGSNLGNLFAQLLPLLANNTGRSATKSGYAGVVPPSGATVPF